MKTVQSIQKFRESQKRSDTSAGTTLGLIASCSLCAVLSLTALYLSLIATSTPLEASQKQQVTAAIDLLDARGFAREAFLLRNLTMFRRGDNWLNSIARTDTAYAATNFPFQIITLYPDFYDKATDDTERAMILLHEAQHLQGKDEAATYAYVWQHRQQLGWTQLDHGTTPSYVTISELTRTYAPQLFTCPTKVWHDCTETLEVGRK
jgi:hypothetical protein